MNIKKKVAAGSIAVALALGGVAVLAGPASAHIPSITADCDGLVMQGVYYDGNKTNEYSYKVGDAATVSVNFGSSFGPITIPVPQDGATTQVVAEIHDADNTAAYSETFNESVGPCGTVPVVPSVSASVTGQATCGIDGYSIEWTGVVTGVFDGYIAQRVKYTGVSPAVTIADGVAPGTGFTYTTTAAGSATSASAPFHVHVTQAQAGVDPLDADATGNVELKGDCVEPDPIPSTTTDNGEVDCSVDGGGSYVITTHHFLTSPLFVNGEWTFDGAVAVPHGDDTYETVEVSTDVCPAFVTPTPPTATCGGVVTLPGVVDGTSSETENADYSVTSTTPSTITVTADPRDGFQFAAGDGYTLSEGSAVWALANTVCPTTTVTTLVTTGINPTPLFLGGIMALLLGGAFLTLRIRRVI